MELHYPRWERQTINTNNSYPKGISGSEKFSPITVSVSQELYSMLNSVFDYVPKVKLQLFGIKKNEQTPKEVQFTVTNNTLNPQPLALGVSFSIDRVEKVKYTTLVSYALYEFYFCASIINNEGKVLHKIDGNTRFFIASSKKSPKPISPPDDIEMSSTPTSLSSLSSLSSSSTSSSTSSSANNNKQPTPYTFKLSMEPYSNNNNSNNNNNNNNNINNTPTTPSYHSPSTPEILMSMQNGGSYRHTEQVILDCYPDTLRINTDRQYEFTAICIRCTVLSPHTKAMVNMDGRTFHAPMSYTQVGNFYLASVYLQHPKVPQTVKIYLADEYLSFHSVIHITFMEENDPYQDVVLPPINIVEKGESSWGHNSSSSSSSLSSLSSLSSSSSLRDRERDRDRERE